MCLGAGILCGDDVELRKSGAIKMGVQGKQCVPPLQGVRANYTIGENPPQTLRNMLSSANGVDPERPACSAPDGLVKRPIDEDAGIPTKRIEKSFIPSPGCKKLCINRSGQDQSPSSSRSFQGGLCWQVQSVVQVPKRSQDVAIDRSAHRPRNLRK